MTFNTTHGAARTYTDIIVEHTIRDAARMEGNRKKRQQTNDNYNDTEKLKKIALRSGAFASAGNFTFVPVHRDMAEEMIALKENKRNEINKRVEESKTKLTKAYNDAATKIVQCKELSSDDYKSLLKKHYVRGKDSPLGKNKTALKQQWDRRRTKYNVQFAIAEQVQVAQSVVVNDVVDEVLLQDNDFMLLSRDDFSDSEDVLSI
jgi:hypothetical protein